MYFPNLNGLRFIAAFLVILHHSEQFKKIYGFENFFEIPFIYIIGKLGVVLFFVLSGFLITYLLLIEEKDNGFISIKNFYVRRILRIWPLYYLIIFMAYFFWPFIHMFDIPNISITYSVDDFKNLFMYIIFLPNLVLSNFAVVPYASHTWSIGAEEQFYLIWPILFVLFRKNKKIMMIGVIVIYIALKFYLQEVPKRFYGINILNFISTIPIHCMAIGGLVATLSFEKNKIITNINNNFVFYTTTFSTIIFLVFGFEFGDFKYEIYSLLFSIVILNLATNKSLSTLLEYNVLNFLGKISYGLYMWHSRAIVFTIFVLSYFNISNKYILLPIALVLTIFLSHISYKYLEKPFLKLKNKFS